MHHACRWLVLLAKRDTSLQGVTDGLTEIGRSNRMEMNVEITKVIRISRHPPAVHNKNRRHTYTISDMSQY